MTGTATLGELSGDYALDTARTRIGFVARHTFGPRVRGHFEEFQGVGHLNGDDVSKSRVELTIRAGSIHTRNSQRDGLLRSKFLDEDDHPTITFTSTGTQQVDEATFELTGDLTIRGVTKPVTVAFERTGAENDPRGIARIHLRGNATINRADWGVNWNAATGVSISRTVSLEFEVAAVRQA
ncbi:YceI family protein [Rugosimonospora africana]|uniref:Polyisoprenoid-binding protein n=1 Tax=Rugosimonospora africana TaxID=556532 RepID=A0A8J3VNA5_9ACTN|nr:YceI family protein [Rugosimonospora africana]GIH13014.1 polyisoprenoid-binding protein [Rugosimonospora africana]